MEILGHYYVAKNIIPLFDSEKYSSQSDYMMFPNYMHCHEWCYENLWRQTMLDPEMEMIKIHALSDWFVHYGDSTANKYKTGWAYSKMDCAIKATDKAFVRLAELGYLDYKKGDYRFFSERKSFNIFHSIIEYAIELHFLEEFTDENIEFIISSYKNITSKKEHLFSYMADQNILSDQTKEVISQSIDQMQDIAWQNDILLFPVSAMLEKGRVASNQETNEVILQLMHDVCEKVSRSEAVNALDLVTSKVMNFEQYYDGDFNVKSHYINT
ncbi:hypothetical protein [Erwinia mallotivora]|uniref:hypothetical protein n=1 Tax=Erwinia mallotivora TaxID=69222 RepID=UPI0021BF9C81|nr:hypothetical protein [Erwinia mallotivora]